MKVVRIRYNVPLTPMIQDLQRVFTNITVTAQALTNRGGLLIFPEKKRFCYVKEFVNASGVRTHCVVYTLVRDSFIMPSWIQGQVLLDDNVDNPVDHHFMGHEIPVPDKEGEAPEEEIQTVGGGGKA